MRPLPSRRARLAVAVAASASVVAAGTAAAATTSTTGASTAGASTTARAVAGLGGQLVRGASEVGTAPDATRSATFALALRNTGALDAFLASAHAPLTPAQFLARYGPSAAAVATVSSWAQRAGLHVDQVSANRQLVTVSGPAATLATALGTRFARFTDGTHTWTQNVGAGALPAPVAAVTSSVLGLSDLGQAAHPLKVKRAATVTFGGSFGPADFARIYHAPSAATGSGQTVAVIAEGNLTQVKKDLVTFEQRFGLPQVPVTTIGAGSADVAGAAEYDLDTQYSTGLAPNVSSLRIYDGASLSNADVAKTIASWVSENASKQASFSAGECELLASVTGFTTGLDNTLKQADAQGQTLFTSSGDTGSFCPAVIGVNGVPAGLPGVNYPAASPYAIGVGGTTLLTDTPTEIAWYAGGGGIAYTEPVATFQANAGGSYVGVRRGVPDVALDADPNSGYRVIVNGTEQTIGGTSASAPAWQGIWARAQGAKGGALGFAGPVIYAEPSTAYHDITIGAIGAFVATPGYDYTTGRGTPDITAFVNGS